MDTRDGRIYDYNEVLQVMAGKSSASGLKSEDIPYLKEMGHYPTPNQRAKARVARNDSCPCGSSKKFKRCCLFQK